MPDQTRGDLLTLGAMAAVAVLGSSRGRMFGSPSRRPRYACEITYVLTDAGDEDRDAEVIESGWIVGGQDLPTRHVVPIEEADDNQVREVLHLDADVDVSRAPAWLRSAISFAKKALDEGYTSPESASGVSNAFFWPTWGHGYDNGGSRSESMSFSSSSRGSILGLRVEHDKWPWEARALATLLVRHDMVLPSSLIARSRSNRFRTWTQRVHIPLPSKWDLELEERIRPDLASALGVPEQALIPVS